MVKAPKPAPKGVGFLFHGRVKQKTPAGTPAEGFGIFRRGTQGTPNAVRYLLTPGKAGDPRNTERSEVSPGTRQGGGPKEHGAPARYLLAHASGGGPKEHRTQRGISWHTSPHFPPTSSKIPPSRQVWPGYGLFPK